MGAYIIDEGDYYLTVGTDAHDALNNILAAQGHTGMVGLEYDDPKWERLLDQVTYEEPCNLIGLGYLNNCSHMRFDLRTGAGFSQWLATSFNAHTPTFYVTGSGFTMKLGALRTVIEPWGLYIPAADQVKARLN